MRTKHLLYGWLGLALACVPAAAAQSAKVPKGAKDDSAITLAAKPTIVVYSGVTTLSGRVSGADARAVTVRLEEDSTRPYGDSYKPSGATTTTDPSGRYAFALKPLQNTQYRAIAHASPRVTSAARLVLVRTLVGAKVSDSTPVRGTLVRFSGSVFPAHDGRPVHIQKRSTTGRFVTVARTTLRDAGAARSSYSRRIKVVRDGVYRVKVPGDGDHVNGFSRARSIDVAG